MKYINCDKCEKECPPFDEAIDKGWFLTMDKLSASGIPWDIVCPECLHNSPVIEGLTI